MNNEKKRVFGAVSVLVGTCIGAGVLGIPYVAAKAGFFVAISHILILGAIILLVNLYLGEIALRTKGDHQITGYAKKYLGKTGMVVTQVATIFGIYSAIIAYLLGIGVSFSFLFFGNFDHTVVFGVVFGVLMMGLLHRGMKALRRFEKVGVGIILVLLLVIFATFISRVNYSNLFTFDFDFLFLPFGVVLFSLMSFHAVPAIKIILKNNKKSLKGVLFAGTFISVIFYILFAFVVVGFMGADTPEVATLVLGPVFIVLGIFTMFTSYLALGNALMENLEFDEKISKGRSWALTSIVPVILFVFIHYFEFFTFTAMLSIAGLVSGGLTAIVILFMIKSAKKNGDREPEYSIPANWFIIIFLSSIFVIGMFLELLEYIILN